MGFLDPRTQIVRVDEAEPEQRLAAAVLMVAVEDATGRKVARRIQADARDFFATARCLPWLGLVAGERELEELQGVFLAMVGQSRRVPRQTVIEGCL